MAHRIVRRGGGGAARGGAGPRSTTQIDDALRLSWCTDNQPDPTLYPKHGSHEAPPRPAPRRRRACVDDPRAVIRCRHASGISLGTVGVAS